MRRRGPEETIKKSREDQESTAQREGRPWRPIALVVAAGCVVILARVFNVGHHIGALRDWIGSLGALAPVAFVVIYAAATVAALPGSVLTVAAGALFGSLLGVVTVSIASTLGATLAFLISRYFARDAVARWLSKKESFQRLDTLSERHGAFAVALTRLVPLFPFNLLNYGLGLTRVRLGTYVFWSWLCMLPATVLCVVGADAVSQAVREGRVPWAPVGAIARAGTVLAVLVRFARKKMQEKGVLHK